MRWRLQMKRPLLPRKLPRQARARATRDAILEAAAQIIGAGGLSAFNTNAVAERAGVSIGSLYQYFGNKDALMVALIHRQQENQLTSVTKAVASVERSDLTTTIRVIVRAAMQHHHDNALLASAIDHEEARLPLDAELTAYLDQGGELIRHLLERHASEIANVDLDQAVITLPALVRAVTDSWANRHPPMLDVAENEAVRAVLGYLRGRR
jgi:AcrR family transcriptional regulator